MIVQTNILLNFKISIDKKRVLISLLDSSIQLLFLIFDICFIFYPSMQQKPHSQFLSPKDSQAPTIVCVLLLLFIMNYMIDSY